MDGATYGYQVAGMTREFDGLEYTLQLTTCIPEESEHTTAFDISQTKSRDNLVVM
jgi:hypothetical protein